MEPTERLVAGVVVVALSAVGFAAGRMHLRPRDPVVQPILFSHSAHTDVECETCHEGIRSSMHSGLPGLSTCLLCHEEPFTESAEEEKILRLSNDGQEQVFRKLFRLPDNVYYTHRRHVAIAELECDACHGAIAQTETPPETPLVRITMDLCLDCHEHEGVSTDCTRCHR